MPLRLHLFKLLLSLQHPFLSHRIKVLNFPSSRICLLDDVDHCERHGHDLRTLGFKLFSYIKLFLLLCLLGFWHLVIAVFFSSFLWSTVVLEASYRSLQLHSFNKGTGGSNCYMIDHESWRFLVILAVLCLQCQY